MKRNGQCQTCARTGAAYRLHETDRLRNGRFSQKRGQMIRMLMLMCALLVSKKVQNVKSALKSENRQLSQETFEHVA